MRKKRFSPALHERERRGFNTISPMKGEGFEEGKHPLLKAGQEDGDR
ncbi:MAG: hypothetical protein ACE144_07315 [Thermodesulfobacteriota bacterium]